jgi:hypothetical protein
MSSTAEECVENAQRCETLAKLQSDSLVKAALLEAAHRWRERKLLIELARCQPTDYWEIAQFVKSVAQRSSASPED